jgi:hypothetical protein
MANVAPHKQEIRLYYTGGFVTEHPVLTAMGNSYLCPPIGGYLEVPRYIAKNLTRRNRMPNGVSVFTENKQFAEAVISARSRQAMPETVVERALTREELLEQLAMLDAEAKEENKPRRTAKAEVKEGE